MKLSVDSLTKGLEFHGEVQGKRQHYYILSSPRQYFVMSVSLAKRDAGNFNMVSRTAVERSLSEASRPARADGAARLRPLPEGTPGDVLVERAEHALRDGGHRAGQHRRQAQDATDLLQRAPPPGGRTVTLSPASRCACRRPSRGWGATGRGAL
jgi:hypothetical protein